MKNIKLIPYFLILFAIVLNACSSAAEDGKSTGGSKPQASAVAFTGMIESINGDQWVVNGQSIKLDMQVDSSVIKDGPFVVGDTVTVEAHINADGSVVALRVETPSAADLANSNSNNNSSDDASTNDDNSKNANSNDNSGNEVSGIVDAITATSITVGGQTYQFLPGFEMIIPGASVDIQLIVNSDGTFTVSGVELSGSSQDGNDNSNNANSNDDNGNDGNDDNGNDDDGNGNDDNGNDD